MEVIAMTFYGEFGDTVSTQMAAQAQAESTDRQKYFQSLLETGNLKEARSFARKQRRNGVRIFSVLLKQAEQDAKRQINRP